MHPNSLKALAANRHRPPKGVRPLNLQAPPKGLSAFIRSVDRGPDGTSKLVEGLFAIANGEMEGYGSRERLAARVELLNRGYGKAADVLLSAELQEPVALNPEVQALESEALRELLTSIQTHKDSNAQTKP